MNAHRTRRDKPPTRHALGRVRGLMAASIILGLLCEASAALFPWLHQILIDRVITQHTMSLGLVALLYAGCAIMTGLFSYLFGLASWRRGLRYEQILKDQYFDHLCRRPVWRSIQDGAPAHVSRLSNDITVLDQDYATPMQSVLIYSPLIVVYAAIVTAVTSWQITAILLIGAILIVLTPSRLKEWLAKQRKEHLDAVARYTTVVDGLLRALGKVNRLTRPGFIRVNARATRIVAEKRHEYGRAKVAASTLVQAETFLLQLGVFALVGWLALRGDFTIGQVVATLAYATAFLVPLQEIVDSSNAINSTTHTREAIDALLTSPGEVQEEVPQGRVEARPAASVGVVLKDAWITGSGADRYSLTIPSGSAILLRAEPGTGKTTLLEGLDQLRQVEGVFEIDGVTPSPATRHWVGLADQVPVILPGSFPDNVTLYAAYPFERDRYDGLLKIVPDFESLLGLDDCSHLSGGERQFLVACRLLTTDPALVLLDEPFSALPHDTAARLLAELIAGLHGTVVCASHASTEIDSDFNRVIALSTVRSSDT